LLPAAFDVACALLHLVTDRSCLDRSEGTQQRAKMVDGPDELVELYRARTLPEAHAIRLLLEAEGITVRIDNELLQGAVGDLPLGWATAPRVLVARSNVTAARVALERVPRESSDAAGGDSSLRCMACGTAMGEADTCPSCDWSYRTGSRAPAEPASEVGGEEVMRTSDDSPAVDTTPPPAPPDRRVWWEVAAILAVGVVPHILSAVPNL